MICETVKIILKLWGLPSGDEVVAKLCQESAIVELRKEEVRKIPPNTLVIFVDGIFELSRVLLTSGDILYLDQEQEIKCLTQSGSLVYTPAETLSRIFGDILARRLCRATKFLPPPDTEDVSVGLFIRKVPVVASPSTTLSEASQTMSKLGISSIIVVDQDDRPIGILTDTDLRKIIAEQVNLSKTLSEIAIKPVYTANEKEPVSTVLERMLLLGIKHMVVTDDEGRVVGMVTLRDLYDAYTAIPIVYLRELQRSLSLEELSVYYSRIIRQVLNVVSRRHVDIEELSRNFTILRTLVLSRLLTLVAQEYQNDVVVLAGGSLLTYDHLFGEEIPLYVIGIDEKALSEVASRLRNALARLLDMRELVKIEILHLKEVLKFEETSPLFCDVVLFSRPIWGNTAIVDEVFKPKDELFRTRTAQLVRVLCESLEVPLDIFGRIKLRTLNLYRNVLMLVEKLISGLFLLATQSRPGVQVCRMIDMLVRVGLLDEDLGRSLKMMYSETKQLVLKIAVENYLTRASPVAEINVDKLSEAELEHIKHMLELVRDLRSRVRDVASKHTAI